MGNPSPAFTLLRAATALALAAVPALARDDARHQQQQQAARAPVRLEMITLIADRQGTDPRQVAASITIVSGEDLCADGNPERVRS